MLTVLLALSVLSQVSVDEEVAQIRRYLSTVGAELSSQDLDKLEAVSKEIQATVDRISKEKRDAASKQIDADFRRWMTTNYPELPQTKPGFYWFPHYDIWFGKNHRKYPDFWNETNRFWRNNQ